MQAFEPSPVKAQSLLSPRKIRRKHERNETELSKVSWGALWGSLPDFQLREEAVQQILLPQKAQMNDPMTKPLKPSKECYSELEAADYLNISLTRLHSLLDEHIFNDKIPRPAGLVFCDVDLVLLEFWIRSQENPKVIRMPRRSI